MSAIAPTLWMLGHSDRTFPAFVELLQVHDLQLLVDIRAYPASRRHPQFDRLELERRLPARGIDYRWMPKLGGMRKPVDGSQRNVAWKEDGFRAYADHLVTEEFQQGWQELAGVAKDQRTAAMCAEAQPLHCHRQILADAFVARGWHVAHVVDARPPSAHRLATTAHVDATGQVSYPGEPQLPF